MNNPSNALSNDAPSSSAEVIENVLQTAEKLSDILGLEYRALLEQNITLIDSVKVDKAELLKTLAELEPQLRVIYNASELTEGEDVVKEMLELCREKNARNHSLVLVVIDQNRKSLSLLRNVLQLDQSSVYSSEGELNADKSKRYLGSA